MRQLSLSEGSSSLGTVLSARAWRPVNKPVKKPGQKAERSRTLQIHMDREEVGGGGFLCEGQCVHQECTKSVVGS